MAGNVNENEMVMNLIDAIDSGSSVEIQSTFNELMANKISAAIDAFRTNVAQQLFNTPGESE